MPPETDTAMYRLPHGSSGGDIYRLMAETLAELPAIGKNQRNEEQRFMFRGYDDTINALNPILADKGLVPIPDVIERDVRHRQTSGGKTMYEVNLHVRYTMCAPDGSWITGSAWGEGTDMGDKATSKAMTMAFKSWLFQAFAISVAEASDPDRRSAQQSDPETYTCAICAEEGTDYTTSVQQEMRNHLVELHGWVRRPDGAVVRPRPSDPPADTAPATQTRPAAPPAQQDDSGAESGPSSDGSAVAAATADEPADEPTAPAITRDDVTMMDKKTLVGHLTERGLKTSGNIQALKDRLVEALEQGSLGETADPAPAGPPPQPSEPATADAETAATGGDFQCPDCDVFPFKNEEDYLEHWYKAHGDEDGDSAEDPGATDPNGADANDDRDTGENVGDVEIPPVDPGTLGDIKSLIARLSGAAARAYATYRREHRLGKPEDLNLEQAGDLLEFLEKVLAT